VRALIIAPTRELAEQINTSVTELGAATKLRSTTIYGGVSADPQVRRLRAGVDIVVACPGRLLDHIGEGNINLSSLEVLVLDEADRMFDMGFLPDIRRILRKLPVERQNLMFSATMPDDIRQLSKDILRDPATVQIGQVMPAVTVAHALYPVESHLKTALLLQLLKHTSTESVLIFTRTKHRAKRLAQQIERDGYTTTSLHGNRSQNQRQAALDGFRSGEYQIMVATDIAARGLDVESVSHVINYDIPDTPDAYIHRIGRTGRAAKTGDAFTLVTGEDTLMIKAIERAIKQPLERRTLSDFDYRQPAPQKDVEFARPPREPQGRRQPRAAASATPARPAVRAVPNGPRAPLQPTGRTAAQAAARTAVRSATNAGKGNNRVQPARKRSDDR
jgi:ATP-dependent RNA helicase RhlE